MYYGLSFSYGGAELHRNKSYHVMEFQLITRSKRVQILHHGSFWLVLRFFSLAFVFTVVSMFLTGHLMVSDLKKMVSPVAEISGPSLVVFSHIPKTGSDFLGTLLRRAVGKNVTLHQGNCKTGKVRKADEEASEDDEENCISPEVLGSTRPALWTGEILYSKLIAPSPPTSSSPSPSKCGDSTSFVSMISDPITKFKGHFYSAHPKSNLSECVVNEYPECVIQQGQPMSTPIRYFCGRSADCRKFASNWALQVAVQHVEACYGVVGVFEEMEATLKKMEEVLPQYFADVSYLYDAKMYNETEAYQMSLIPLAEEAEDKLRKMLYVEYEFYDIILRRLKEPKGK